MHQVRSAAVAGSFYPAQGPVLSRAVQDLLQPFAPSQDAGQAPPKALIVPHAGYVYSGSTAGQAYAQLTPWRQSIRRVVLPEVLPAAATGFARAGIARCRRFHHPAG